MDLISRQELKGRSEKDVKCYGRQLSAYNGVRATWIDDKNRDGVGAACAISRCSTHCSYMQPERAYRQAMAALRALFPQRLFNCHRPYTRHGSRRIKAPRMHRTHYIYATLRAHHELRISGSHESGRDCHGVSLFEDQLTGKFVVACCSDSFASPSGSYICK